MVRRFLVGGALAGALALACGAAVAGEPTPAATPAATQPAKVKEGYRHLGAGSWIVSKAVVQSSTGIPSNVKRKVSITADPTTGRRALEEARWSGSEFEPTGPAQSLAPVDPRTFDELGWTPTATLADQPVAVGRRRYACAVTRYEVRNDTDGRVVELTLYREKSGAIKLPARSLAVAGREIPLPADAVQAEFTVEGPKVSTRGTRRIMSLSAMTQVNGKPVACLVEQTQTRGTSNDKPTATSAQEWYCEALPGERVRAQTTTTIGAIRVDSDVTVLEFGVVAAGAPVEAKRALGE
ncbi:MAG: hypothetical protein ACAI43_04660 [Phycisphaerae bacterium]